MTINPTARGIFSANRPNIEGVKPEKRLNGANISNPGADARNIRNDGRQLGGPGDGPTRDGAAIVRIDPRTAARASVAARPQPKSPTEDPNNNVKGDLNGDGLVTNADSDAFVLALTDAEKYKATYKNGNIKNGDLDGSGNLDFNDIDAFRALLEKKSRGEKSPDKTTEQTFQQGDLNGDGVVDNTDVDAFVKLLSDKKGFEAEFGSDATKRADLNNDGTVDFNDIDGFNEAVKNSGKKPAEDLKGDINGDGVIDNKDVDSFVSLLTGDKESIIKKYGEGALSRADLDGNGSVDFNDIDALSEKLGK